MKIFKLDNNHYISYRQQEFDKNDITLIYVHGLMSDMNGLKARSIEEYAQKNQINYVVFDNLGHGESSGEYHNCNISSWLETLTSIIKALGLKNCILIGSSMGGWISLLAAQLEMSEIAGLILIAPAPDFTEKIWYLLSDKQRAIMKDGHILSLRENLPISYQLLEDGKKHLMLSKDKIHVGVPVIMMHGMEDNEIEYDVSLRLAKQLECPYLCTKLAKYSTHRMGTEEDITLLLNSIDEIIKICSRM
ncbi:MAG: alpha/beta hydrolase [Rickettsiaceae bacterium]|nr:alpha/beta hydrolase [Rickettsiaceae bacterium]